MLKKKGVLLLKYIEKFPEKFNIIIKNFGSNPLLQITAITVAN